MKTEITIVKENEMQYAIYIGNEIYTRTGAMFTAKKIQKELDFIYNVGREKNV